MEFEIRFELREKKIFTKGDCMASPVKKQPGSSFMPPHVSRKVESHYKDEYEKASAASSGNDADKKKVEAARERWEIQTSSNNAAAENMSSIKSHNVHVSSRQHLINVTKKVIEKESPADC